MVLYRRNFVPGGTFFFTVTLLDRRADALTRHIDVLRGAFATVKSRRPFRIDALVILPDHLHALWTLPPGDADYAGRWRAIKSAFVRGIDRVGEDIARNERGEARVWQPRYWEHTIRDDADFAAHCDYIHYNPVKHGNATRPADWPHSTLHRFIEQGVCPQDWGTDRSPDAAQRNPGGFGERR